MRADPDNDADHRNRAPQAEHRAAIEQAQQTNARAATGPTPAACPADARLALARGLVIVAVLIDDLGFEGLFLRLLFRGSDPIPRPEAQFGKRCAEAELRLLAPAALFPSPRHTRT